jgi:lipoate-protein ligase A
VKVPGSLRDAPLVQSILRWRVVNDPPLPGAVNMARDHGLAVSLQARAGVLRLYRWDPPTVSFGRNEPSKGLYSKEKAEKEGVAFVRRPTGGRAVLHHQELTYALVFPLGAFGGLKKAYRLVNEGLLAGLQKLGVPVQLAASLGPSLPPDAGACFRQPAEGEVTALGRKLIGSAQVRIGDSFLQHGSIILDGDQDMLRRLRADDEPVPPPATLKSLLGVVPELDVLGFSLQQGLAEILGGSWAEDGYRSDEKMAAEELEAHYEDSDWTWRF